MSRVLITVLALCASVSAQSVLLISADDMGIERMSLYGLSASNANTPNLDELARRGTVIETAWSAPVCSPTRAMLLTGDYPFHNGVGTIFSAEPGPDFIKGAEVFIPEAVPSADAALFGKWHLNDNDPALYNRPIDQGFDIWQGTPTGFPTITEPGDQNYSQYIEALAVAGMPPVAPVVSGYATTRTTDQAIQWIDARDGPWFMAVMYNAPHAPYHKPPQGLHTLQLGAGDPNDDAPLHHRAMVEAMDTEIGRLLESIDLSTTLVIFIGDNGTQEAAYDGPAQVGHQKGTLFEAGIRVPMIVAGAGVRRGRIMGGFVSAVDVFPTVIEAFGETPPTSDGISILTQLRCGRPSPRLELFSEQFRPNSGQVFFAEEAARIGDFKLVRRNVHFSNPELIGSKFFNLKADPNEEVDLLLGVLTPREAAALGALEEMLDGLGKT